MTLVGGGLARGLRRSDSTLKRWLRVVPVTPGCGNGGRVRIGFRAGQASPRSGRCSDAVSRGTRWSLRCRWPPGRMECMSTPQDEVIARARAIFEKLRQVEEITPEGEEPPPAPD